MNTCGLTCNLKLYAFKTVIPSTRRPSLDGYGSKGRSAPVLAVQLLLKSCEPPTTVKGMPSFIGAVKESSRVIPGCSSLLVPLEDGIAGYE